jgi:hypothetical protein
MFSVPVLRCSIGALMLVGALLLVGPIAGAQDHGWPPFLPDRAGVRDAATVERVWAQPTFARHLDAPPLDVPIALYSTIIDAPDVLAAGARKLGLTDESARENGDGSFTLVSPRGSRATYRVLVAEAERRATLSTGTKIVAGVGVDAIVLGELRMSSGAGPLRQHLDVYVRVENPILSGVARALQFVLPGIADNELLRGFGLAAAVAHWAIDDRSGFCSWLEGAGVGASRRARVAAAARCATPPAVLESPGP